MNRVIKVAFFGDSVTYGRGHDGKTISEEKIWTNLVSKRFNSIHNGSGLFLYSCNLGKNGDTTRGALERLNEVYSFNPEIVVAQFGLNDCNCWMSDNGIERVPPASYSLNQMEIANKLLASGVKKILWTTNYTPPYDRVLLNNISYYNNILRYNDIASTFDGYKDVLEVYDLYKSFTKENDSVRLNDYHLLFLCEDDRWIHLSETGHYVYSRIIFHPLVKMIEGVLK